MKTICFTLLLTALTLGAQAPPAGADATNRNEARREVRRVPGGATNVTEGKAASTRSPAPALSVPRTNLAPAGTPPQTFPPTTTAAPTPTTPGAPTTVPPALPPATLPPATPSATTPAAPTATATATPAATPTNPGEEVFPPGTINWTAADINQVLTIYAEYVGRTIIRPSTLNAAPIALKTQTPLTKTELIQVLNAALALNGIEMVNIGDKFVKAVLPPQAYGAGAALGTNDSATLPDLGGFMTHVVQLKYLKPTELVPILTQFASIATAVVPIDTSMIIVLRDHTENVKRMLEMIDRTDVSVPSEFISEVIPIKFAKAEEIASALGSLGGAGGGAGTSIGSRPAGGATSPTSGRPGTTGYTPGQPFTPGQVGSPAGTPSSGASFSDRLQQIVRRASQPTGDLQILGTTKIIADVRSNSLLIFATRQDMAMIKDIVSKLDVVLAQVLIETIIMDVSLDDTFKLGVSAVQTTKQFGNNSAGAGGMNANKFFDFGGAGTNALGDLLGSGLKYFGKINDDFYVSLEAMASDGRVNVLQKPQIQTSHATPARIFIGGTVPYVSSTYYGGGYAGGPSSSYQQLPVGISLAVTPFINADGLVFLKIEDFSIDEIAGSTDIQGVGAVPNTTKRQLLGEIAVKDRETIMLGGFIRNSNTKSRSGVPFLKDIPLLGYLFRSTGESKERKELLVLMRPTVLRTPEIASAQVEIEKQRLPGVFAAEKESEREERKAIEAEKKRSFREDKLFDSGITKPDQTPQFSEP